MEKLKESLTLQEILQAIPYLSDQEGRILEARLKESRHRKTRARQVLRETFGLWRDREDIPDSVDYVNNLRSSWGRRLQRYELNE